MLNWANRFNIFCFLDNQDYSIQPQQYDCLLAAGAVDTFEGPGLNQVNEFIAHHNNWIFGHLAYDLKNSIHHFKAIRKNPVGFPDIFFFTPKVLLRINGHEVVISGDDPSAIYREIESENSEAGPSAPVAIQQKLSKQEYLRKIAMLQQHIARGDCYEINFCQEFFAGSADIDPVAVYAGLTELSPNPFSALYRLDDKYLMCASPERYLMKKGDRLFSQPMKGTIRRNVDNHMIDEELKKELRESAKDQSENVMVVDMVRNDLSKICVDATVKVDELFGVYTYPHVHQMISTVSGELLPGTGFAQIIEATFPMGSMTGAPKHRVMQLIDEYEVSGRGIFSGSVGYISPDGDFDFNVVIRSAMYNASRRYLSYQVGSGITFYSDPEKEWEECLLKGAAMKRVIEGK